MMYLKTCRRTYGDISMERHEEVERVGWRELHGESYMEGWLERVT